MTKRSRFFSGSYSVGSQSGSITLELAGDGTFYLQELVEPFAGSAFTSDSHGEWVEAEDTVTLTFCAQRQCTSSHTPWNVRSCVRRPGAIDYDSETTLVQLLQPPSDWKRS